MMNISPIGRNCSREERNDYEKIDLAQDIRKNMVAAMKKEFADLDLHNLPLLDNFHPKHFFIRATDVYFTVFK